MFSQKLMNPIPVSDLKLNEVLDNDMIIIC